MPEIAEVRTVAKTLNNTLKGRKIISIETPYNKIIKSNLEEFINKLEKQKFQEVSSCGKWLIFNLGEYSYLSHLRMEGKYFIKPSKEEFNKHEHIIFHLDNNQDLRYHDVRKFGVMILSKTKDLEKVDELTKLGIEPDSPDLKEDYLYEHCHKSTKPIKELLLDQSIINGLGNIYVDEVLFSSRINPQKLGNKLTKKDCKKIIESCQIIIPKATELGGTTIRSYTSSLGVTGHYQDYLCVHTKVNKPCPVCGSLIKKIRVGGRGTYYCPTCQKE